SLQTGANGTYGLVAAGESFWEVLVIPEADMHITSENPQYVPVYHDGILEHSGINFCISTGANAVIVRNGNSTTSATATNGIILVPEAGAPARQPQSGFIWFVTAVSIGVAFFFFGLLVEWKRRRNQITH
ncbi:MAG: hypothetical protein GY943_14825, partial [Chloroflexi bacterium]|nr:hypothetical protein [Chloroflexota bacterium]